MEERILRLAVLEEGPEEAASVAPKSYSAALLQQQRKNRRADLRVVFPEDVLQEEEAALPEARPADSHLYPTDLGSSFEYCPYSGKRLC